jgi:hypothetical protein
MKAQHKVRVSFLSVLFVASLAHAAEKPPLGINAHFAWCGQPKDAADKLNRFEGFWKTHLPPNPDEYNDQLHVRLVRKCAYRLCELYVAKSDTKNAQKMIRWLEANDDSLAEVQP